MHKNKWDCLYSAKVGDFIEIYLVVIGTEKYPADHITPFKGVFPVVSTVRHKRSIINSPVIGSSTLYQRFLHKSDIQYNYDITFDPSKLEKAYQQLNYWFVCSEHNCAISKIFKAKI